MTLRKKAIIITAVVLPCIMVVLMAASYFIILSHFDALERSYVKRNVERAYSALADDLANLQAVVGDWGFWDDTYDFMLSKDAKYLVSNIQDSTFTNLHVDYIAFFNTHGGLVYGRSYDNIEKRLRGLPPGLVERLPFTKAKQGISGIIKLKNGNLSAFSACPILNSNMDGPSRGTLVMGRILDAKEISRLAKVTHLSFTVNLLQGRLGPDDSLWNGRSNEYGYITIKPISEKVIAGFYKVRDIYGNTVGLLKVVIPREVHIQGKKTTLWYSFYLFIAGLLFSVFILRLLESLILSRLVNLNESLKKISYDKDLSYRITLSGNDELTNVARTINEMLATLEKSQYELRISEAKLRAMFQNTPNPIFIIDWETKETYGTNQAGLDFLECSFDELGEKKCWEKLNRAIHGSCAEGPLVINSQTIEVGCEVHGKRKTMLINLVPVNNEGKSLIYVIGQDITDRKQMEEQLTYMSMNDSLTGMYNRIYFERELKRYESSEYRPLGFIRCDIDGLKLINDSLGNKTGDKLIIAVSGFLRQAVGDMGLIARTGGDDFTVLVPNASETQLESIINAIRNAIAEFNTDQTNLPLSLSLGFELSNDLPVEEVLKNAEHNMIREKLHRTHSAKNATVQALMKAMEARDFITEGHAERMEELIVRLGASIGLPEPRIADLRLLAQFHDIGKVGIPDRILLKPGALSEEEQKEMRRHCEIGYRIALSTPDLAPIAQGILKHHEWWNGNGYPLGLKGKEIPLECRLLSIVDAFDAMTNDRPYRKALPIETAIAEVQKCAGVQFDPQLAEKFIKLVKKEG